MESSTQEADKPQIAPRQRILENLTSLGLALLIVFMVRSSIIEAFKIPSGSMIPTLLIGDHIFVNKFAYGLKIPFSDLVTNEPVFIVKREGPQRGDIVVFKFPKDESFYYIKRVIGVPGDQVEIKEKALLINGAPVARDLAPPDTAKAVFSDLEDPKYSPNDLELFNEHLNKTDHLMLLAKSNYMDENFGPVTVPPESYFVMGDNRDFSNDSRFWGFVPFKNIKGKAMVIWLSFWLSFSNGEFTFRPERIGTVLH